MAKIINVGISALVFLNVARLWPPVGAGKVEIKCPEFCECDIYEKLRRAVCQRRKLVSIELNVPPQAEILDLSHNQIGGLEDRIFMKIGLTDLKLLNLSHNKVHQIHFNGFVGLERLKTLDLSFNALEYFTGSWFDSFQSLKELYLRGNKLRTINEQPLINIETLHVLDISKCGITRLNPNTFRLIPNLEVLDISENYIQRIKADVLKALPRLVNLQARDNNFNCNDKNLIEVSVYVKSRKIQYADTCNAHEPTVFNINSRLQKFERMQMESSTPEISVKNSWMVNEDRNNDSKIVEACSNGTFKFSGVDNDDDDSLLMDIIKLSPWITLSVTFSYGMACGIALTCAINLCMARKRIGTFPVVYIPQESIGIRNAHSVPNLANKRKRLGRSNSALYTTLQRVRKQISRENADDGDGFDETLMMNEFDLANSTPVAVRKTLMTH